MNIRMIDCSFRRFRYHEVRVEENSTKNQTKKTKKFHNACLRPLGQHKVVNAAYCSDGAFAHVPWRHGSVAHVNVTSEEYRKYERRVQSALRRIERRVVWLRQGTREVFGTILESNIYILIDTSSSMVNYIDFVKERLEILVREQLEARKCKSRGSNHLIRLFAVIQLLILND